MTESFKNNTIENALKDIFKSKLGLDYDQMLETYPNALDLNLLGKELHRAPRDLVYIFFEVEKVFGIHISEQAVLDGFHTFSNIMGCILNQKATA